MSAEASRVLVTGATGFLGRHLADLLLQRGSRVFAITAPDDAAADALPDTVARFPCDVRDTRSLAQILGEILPETIYHLAGLARGDDLPRLLDVNVLGTDSLLQAVGQLAERPRVVIPGSAAEYGMADGDAAWDETLPLRPVSAYGVSKAAQTLLGRSYALRGQAPVIIGRVFNITGPGEPASMVCGHVASQIAACEAGQGSATLKIGSLAATRDFLDVRDVVRALTLLASDGRPGEVYNICSGVGRRMEDVVRQLAGLSSVPVLLPPNLPGRRPTDVLRSVGDCRRLRAATGFEPAIPLAQTLQDLLAWWRAAQGRARPPR